MIRVTFEVEVGENEVCDVRDRLSAVVRDLRHPTFAVHYRTVSEPIADDVGGITELEPEDISPDDRKYLKSLVHDTQEARDADVPPRCGEMVEIRGFEYVVAVQHIDGSLQLRLRQE